MSSVYIPAEYWRNLHERHPDELTAVGFDLLGEGYNKNTYQLRFGAVDNLLKRQHVNLHNEDVFEAAVGIGAYGPFWARFGVHEWNGCDICPNAVDSVSAQWPRGRFFTADISNVCGLKRNLGRPSRTYRLVTAVDVMYHIVDNGKWESALGNLADLVAPGGHLLVSDVFCPRERQVAAHVRRRPMGAWNQVLNTHRLRLIDREPVYSILGDPTPCSPFDVTGRVLQAVWWTISHIVQFTPERWRNGVGAAISKRLMPVDRFLCRKIMRPGLSLEMALFRKDE